MTHGGTSDGTDNSSSPSDGDADTHAASAPLPDLWQRHVGGLSQLSHDHDPDRCAAPHPQNPALHHPVCPQFRHPYRPEAEGRLALPKHEFGLDIIALVGTLRHAQHRSVPEIHQELAQRHITIAPRTVLHLLERYDELVALSLADPLRLQRVT